MIWIYVCVCVCVCVCQYVCLYGLSACVLEPILNIVTHMANTRLGSTTH